MDLKRERISTVVKMCALDDERAHTLGQVEEEHDLTNDIDRLLTHIHRLNFRLPVEEEPLTETQHYETRLDIPLCYDVVKTSTHRGARRRVGPQRARD